MMNQSVTFQQLTPLVHTIKYRKTLNQRPTYKEGIMMNSQVSMLLLPPPTTTLVYQPTFSFRKWQLLSSHAIHSSNLPMLQIPLHHIEKLQNQVAKPLSQEKVQRHHYIAMVIN